MAGFYDTHVRNPLTDENPFRSRTRERSAIPGFRDVRSLLPDPWWTGHETAIDCWWKVWELAFRNIKQPTKQNGFVSRYIDTAFNDNLFMWDSCFILLFARYGSRAFNFQRTLDNLYCKQHSDGFIAREIRESDGSDCQHRFDPSSTGPNVLAWTEWEYFLVFNDKKRLKTVFPALAAYHQWLRKYHTWPDGSYWATGWGCGMDNQPRLGPDAHFAYDNGHLTWIDACFQQAFSADLLSRMAVILGRKKEAADFRSEADRLTKFVNEKMWDEKTGFYYDLDPEGRTTGVKSVAGFWGLLAGIVPDGRISQMTGHLEKKSEFNRPHRVPSLAASHPGYTAGGGYWKGAIWPPTNYMILRGLTRYGKDDLSHEIAMNHHANVVRVFEKTGTVWENYAPEKAVPGNPAKSDFVGWGGVPPVAVFLEYVLGLRPDTPNNTLVWDIRLLEAHGVKRYPFGKDGLLGLSCKPRDSQSEKPAIEVSSNTKLKLIIKWDKGRKSSLIRI